MKKLIATLLVFLFLQVQSFARANPTGATSQLETSFSQMAAQVSQGSLKSQEIIDQAKQIVGEAKASGVSEHEFISVMSKKLSLNMSDSDVEKTIADLKANPSQAKIQDLAQQLEKAQSGDKFLMVLLTFAIMSAIMIGIFFLLADPNFPV